MSENKDLGRVGKPTGLSSDDGAASRLHPSGFDPSRLADVKKAEQEAWNTVKTLEGARDAEAYEAADAVRETWRERISAARAAASALYRQRMELEDAAPGHPWEGLRVYRTKSVPRRWLSDPPVHERIEGIVETVRSTTAFPANLSRYSRPKVGEPIVRLCKKGGAPGSKFEKLLGFSNQTAWKLCDSDGSPKGRDRNGLDGEAATARAEGIAQTGDPS